MEFNNIKSAVATQFAKMTATNRLFKVDVEGNELWEMYLASFPPGTNPIFRERTEHDCSCCKSFVRNIGGIVSIENGQIMTLWDGKVGDSAYQAVADAMAALVRSKPIKGIYLHYEKHVGVDKNFEDLLNGNIQQWNHFFVNLPSWATMGKPQIGPATGEVRGTFDVMRRGLSEISTEAIDTVLELIAQNSLYRGEEHKFAVTEFKKLKTACTYSDLFVWENYDKVPQSVSRIRNTSIGTLLVDLSEGMELEGAVKKFEAMVAPANYKRPTALVTQGMIDKAKATVAELGLTSALERRYANFADLTINNVLFADHEAKKNMSTDVFGDLAPTAAVKPTFDKVMDIGINEFIKDVLPNISSMEVFFENKHAANLVSLIAPADATAKPLFKWGNPFSWSYAGEVADSDIRQAVQARGGRVDGVFRFSHSWNTPGQRNASLMDLHVFMPLCGVDDKGGCHDNYGNHQRVGWNSRKHTASGGIQDVDYTPAAPEGYIPVENITFPDIKRMPEGKYICKIHNWQLRQPTKGGFCAEIEFDGQVFQYEYRTPMKNKEWVIVAVVTLKDGVFTIDHRLPTSASSREVWKLPTQQFHRVSLMLNSPNHWDGECVGNKHYMFMIDGCTNEERARGFYNEFLKAELNEHRKVLELVGSKTTVKDTPHQLSGLGFSSTQHTSLICRVKGSFTRSLKINF